ncbi:hypothetical protein UFOVP826_44 [uncultured Caudovirales phage]|uniref:Uncharacterized protein n=1 Tax=uncultured Caudovirales phage TaxID=2100421 RepID=A0A6J5NZK8_9CAUD|nr:hypothetical protein UFOVP826_44 [uncultured Caudovirales phage]
MSVFSFLSHRPCAIRVRDAETALSESALKLSQSIQAMVEGNSEKPVRLKVVHKK